MHSADIFRVFSSGSQTPICYALHSFVLHLAPAVSVLLLLKFGTLSLWLFECVPAMILSAINSRPTTSSRPSNPLSASSLAPQIRLWLTNVCVYKLYLLTYLNSTCSNTVQPNYNAPRQSTVLVLTLPHDGSQILSNKNAVKLLL